MVTKGQRVVVLKESRVDVTWSVICKAKSLDVVLLHRNAAPTLFLSFIYSLQTTTLLFFLVLPLDIFVM